ncbi:MAG TPA: N-acetylmuramoyl-L-alanine amidase [Humidesulfovibrio sp.]|uniref:N-acetylmuramoyl-L-alanine amidase n=1 Tax=Humidesulfovibrio sp. TaxID=2910988 RepID=UPI002D0427F9|nr:N-acetylmuramoyl-L-alanine amidase [Humidesulfovibrio sp.]HWR03440.1 N-acetylmuramoyl-L-alanine amidase [Humidesulfovibrio sp.]
MPKGRTQRAGRTERGAVWLLALLFAALCLLPPAVALAAKAQAKSAAEKSGDLPADAPVRRFQTLLTRKNVTKDALRKLEAELEQARATRPDGPNGAKATFFLARVQQETAKRSGLKADWFKAADTFGQCAERFPKYQLAPDALMHRAAIRLERLSDPEGAASDLQTVQRSYPRSSFAPKAAALQKRIGKSPAPAKATPAPEPAPDPTPARGGEKAMLLEVRPKNNGANARIVLDLDSRVKYRYQLLEHAGGKSSAGRIYVDLLGARPRPGLSEEVQVTGGILRHIRVAPKDADATRVVLDFTDLKDYRVTVLDAPFRLVVDAFSTADGKANTPAPVSAPAPAEEAPAFTAPKGSRKKMAENLVEQLGLTVRTIMVDAGHGGKDPGARGYGLMEKDVNLRMALILGKILKERGFRVIYTRTTDDFLALEERTSLANAKKVDLFVSIHCNAHTDPSMNGLETYSLNLARTPDAVRVAARENSVSDKNISDLQMILTDLMLTSKIKESVDLARVVHRQGLSAIRSKWTVADHGNREAPFYVLMGAKMPSALLEIGYITNKTEAARLKTDAYLKILANGIADGIGEYKQQIERYTSK